MGPHLWVNLRLLAFSGLLFLVLKTAGRLVVAYFKGQYRRMGGRMFNRQFVYSMLMGDLQVHDGFAERVVGELAGGRFRKYQHALSCIFTCNIQVWEVVSLLPYPAWVISMIVYLAYWVWMFDTLFSDSNRLKVGRVKWSEAVGTQSQMPKTQSTQLRSVPFCGSKPCQWLQDQMPNKK